MLLLRLLVAHWVWTPTLLRPQHSSAFCPQTCASAQHVCLKLVGPVHVSFPLQQEPFVQIVFWRQHVSGFAQPTPGWSQHKLPQSGTEQVPQCFGAVGESWMQAAPCSQQTPLHATVPVAQQSPAPALASPQVVPDGQHVLPQISRLFGQHSAVFEIQVSLPSQQFVALQFDVPDGQQSCDAERTHVEPELQHPPPQATGQHPCP